MTKGPRNAINLFLLDVFTCLAESRPIWINSIEYRLKEGQLFTYYRDYKKHKVIKSKLRFNTFVARCVQIPQAGKDTIRRLAHEIRNKDAFDYQDDAERQYKL